MEEVVVDMDMVEEVDMVEEGGALEEVVGGLFRWDCELVKLRLQLRQHPF